MVGMMVDEGIGYVWIESGNDGGCFVRNMMVVDIGDKLM